MECLPELLTDCAPYGYCEICWHQKPADALLPLPAFLLGLRSRFSVVSFQQRHLI